MNFLFSFIFLVFVSSPFAFAEEAPPPAIPAPESLNDWSIISDEPLEEETQEVKEPTGQELLRMGEESYADADYEQAKEYFEKALTKDLPPPEKAKAHVKLAFINAAFGNADKVQPEFAEALKLDRTIDFDPNLVSPKIYESFQSARDEVVREGTLVVNCDPSGALVIIDGEPAGEAPVKKEHLAEGEHTVTLKKPGYETSSGMVTIKKDVTVTIEDKLVEARGEFSIASVPPGVSVLFDGRDAGATPTVIKRVAAGSHKVLLRRDYYEPKEIEESFEQAERKSLQVSLRRRLLLITDGEPGAGSVMGGLPEKLAGYLIEPVDIRKVCDTLAGRGLDPASADFIKQQKFCLSLEDSAVLSSILEKEASELALTASLVDGPKKALRVCLYSLASSEGDCALIEADDLDALKEKFNLFLDRWLAQERQERPTIGARVVDRALGGAEIISVLPGGPAAQAGLIPGNVITGVDGQEVKSKADLVKLLKAGTRQKLTFIERGKSQGAEVPVANGPIETPIDSKEYLYNLALVNFSSVAADKSPNSDREARGIAALNLGNTLMHSGEYKKAVEAYRQADTAAKTGVCAGTALYRLGQACERLDLWTEAAAAYRKALMLYPDATLESAEGPLVGPLAKERLREFYRLGLVKEKWWL